jgi:hypothetical protein
VRRSFFPRAAIAALAAALTAAGAAWADDAGAPAVGAGALAADAGAAGDAGALAADAGAAGDAGALAADAGTTDAAVAAPTCTEHVPEGVARPRLDEIFPPRGLSGYATELKIRITHGRGERVLPEGFRPAQGGEALKALTAAHFVIPEADGGAAPRIEVTPGEAGRAVTTISIPFVPLPPEGGRSTLTLPPLPIAVARANNEYVTVCTQPHVIVIDDPIANELDPKVKPNPPPRPQREEWPLLRQLAIGLPIGLLIAVIAVLLSNWWRARPKAEPPKPKPIPWLVALRELEELRRSTLLEEGRAGEYYDRVSDCIRRYLGARYGLEELDQAYSGLETTTSEMLDLLRRVRPPVGELGRIRQFLEDCDLVKFARVVPSPDECLEALRHGEAIVRNTIPAAPVPAPPTGGPPSARKPPSAEAPP